MIILFLFLRNIKSTLIIGLSIPISLILTMMAMHFFGLTLNIVSLTGLILGLGMIVDNSIVILENIYRYRERGAKPEPAAILGSREMITAIVASTLTTLCVFLPLIIWKDDMGNLGQVFQDMIFTVIISLLISLITAVTVVPALSSRYLRLDSHRQKPLKNRLLKKIDGLMESGQHALQRTYRRALAFSLKNRLLVLSLIMVVFILSIQLFGTLGMNMVPRPYADDKVQIHLTMPVGTALERTESVLKELARFAESEIEGYEDIILSAGAVKGDGGSYTGLLEITLPDADSQIDDPAEIQSKLRPWLKRYPEASFSFSSGRSMSSASPVDIEIRSDDLELAGRCAVEIRNLLKKDLPLVVDPESSLENGAPEYRIVIDNDRAAAMGLSPGRIASELDGLVDGLTPISYWSGGDELDVILRLTEEDRSTLADLESQYITNDSGEKIALSNLARLEKSVGPVSITREDESRIVHVTPDLADGIAVTEVQPLLKELMDSRYIVPPGVEISYGGEMEEIEEYSNPMAVIAIVAVIMVFAVMAALFESLADPFIIFFSIPLLLIGVVAVYKITGEAFSVFSAVGIVILTGIVVNNGIVLVDYTNLLRSRGEDLTRALLNAGQSRLRPILMTSLTTILGMIPMGFFPGEGTDVIRPIGQTVVGGLAVSTLITLFITPVMYSLLNQRNEKARSRRRMQKQDELNLIRQEVRA
jgi:HAE1 family hydrophobic/amphiphilic exporter-1